MMVNQEETIKSLSNEVLRLKLTCHNYEQQLKAAGRTGGRDLDETKRDLIADLMEANEDLKKQLNESNHDISNHRPETSDIACQTNLDRYGIDRLIEDSLSLKKKNKQRDEITGQFQQMKESLLCHKTLLHKTQEGHREQESQLRQQIQQQQQQIQQQKQQLQHQQLTLQHFQQEAPHQRPTSARLHQHYQGLPITRPPQRQPAFSQDYQTLPSRSMTLDEKETLDKLFKLDGLLTVARDKLRAAASN